MSKINTIRGDIVIFENSYLNQNIVLKHDGDEFSLIFDSKIVFRKSTTHSEVLIGDYAVSQENGNLLFKKNNVTLMTLKEI